MPSRAGLVYVPGDRVEALLHAALRAREHRPALPGPAATLGPHPHGSREGDAWTRRHRAAPDRHARPGRGAPPLRRQPAEGDHRPLDRRRRADAALLRPDARHRHPHQAADLPPAARAGRSRAPRCCSTPRNWRRCSSPATAPWSSSAAASSTEMPAEVADEATLMRAAYGLPRGAVGGRGMQREHSGHGHRECRRHGSSAVRRVHPPQHVGPGALGPAGRAARLHGRHPAGLGRPAARHPDAGGPALRLRDGRADDGRPHRRHRPLHRRHDDPHERDCRRR